jgi:hypothetical protein
MQRKEDNRTPIGPAATCADARRSRPCPERRPLRRGIGRSLPAAGLGALGIDAAFAVGAILRMDLETIHIDPFSRNVPEMVVTCG